MKCNVRAHNNKTPYANLPHGSRALTFAPLVLWGTFLHFALALLTLILVPGIVQCEEPPQTLFQQTEEASQPQRPMVRPPRTRFLQLNGPITAPMSEISGLAWHKDQLVLLPQYPHKFTNPKGLHKNSIGRLFAIPKQKILSRIRGESKAPLTPSSITVFGPKFHTRIKGFEGFEAIAISGDTAWLTIEARSKGRMHGFIVMGTFRPGGKVLDIAPDSLVKIAPQANLRNMSYESLFRAGDQIIALYEANGANILSTPKARAFSQDCTPRDSIPFTTVEYRLTDTTALDAQGRFWAINHYWTGFQKLLKPAPDHAAQKNGPPVSHSNESAPGNVERLLLFQYQPDGITLLRREPIQLPPSLLPQNWEGVVRIQDSASPQRSAVRGFLVVTDTHPATILGFVPYTEPDTLQ